MFPKFLKGVSCMLFLKECIWALIHSISLLSIISKLFESMINKKVFGFLKRNNPLNNKQYEFHSSTSTVDILSLDTESVRHSIINSSQEITKAFETKCDIGGCYTNSPAMASLKESLQLSNPSYQAGPWRPLLMTRRLKRIPPRPSPWPCPLFT